MKIKDFIKSRQATLLISVTCFIVAVTAIVFTTVGYKQGLKHKTIIVHVDFDDPDIPQVTDTKYSFMPPELSNYICDLSRQLEIKDELPVAILLQENPNFDPNAVNENKNGTFDIGLFQTNDKYLWSVFVPAYWDLDVEFDPFNWKHNTFIALHLIRDLSESLKTEDEVIMAYNCGIGAAMSGNIPESTVRYLAAVKNNLELLQ